jgi:ABC-type Fe3+/spermidine/putrescine transport system ATPase subunit
MRQVTVCSARDGRESFASDCERSDERSAFIRGAPESIVTQIRIERLTQSYGETPALRAVDLSIGSGELFFLLGPSGCGKTTLLRTIAGLQAPSAGRILFDGEDVTAVPTQQRNAVMCFQGYALWPHLSVRENIRFGLSVKNEPADRQGQLAEVEKALDIIQMKGALADRKPQELSGGQQQRVALARAMAVKPACLLLDEPLSNLDTHLRQDMRREIQRICRHSGMTTVWVTHDQKEALSTADRIAVLRDGQLAQVGTPQELYRSPADAFVAEFIGATNLVEGEVVGSGEGETRVATSLGTLVCARRPTSAARVIVSIRPELIRLSRDGDSAAAGMPINRLVGKVVEETFLGQSSEHLVAVGGGHLRVVSAPPRYGPKGAVTLEFDPADAVVLSR